MMLNNDVSPAADCVAPMWRTMCADGDVFAVGGEVIDIASGRVDSGPTAARWQHQWVLEPTALEGASGPIDVAYVSGGAGLYRREMFLELGGFWDALPGLYWEDVELGLRAWLHGWRSVFHPAARFDHASGSTVRRAVNPRVREFRTYQNVRLTHWALLLDAGRSARLPAGGAAPQPAQALLLRDRAHAARFAARRSPPAAARCAPAVARCASATCRHAGWVGRSRSRAGRRGGARRTPAPPP